MNEPRPFASSAFAVLALAASQLALIFVNPLEGAQTPPAWERIDLGGETACTDGSRYVIYHQAGRSNNLHIFFSPGGACWDAGSCEKPVFFDEPEKTVEGGLYYADALDMNAPAYQTGIFRTQDERNAFRNWSKVFITYCSADVHIGDAERRYQTEAGTTRTILHRGQKNTLAALDWIRGNEMAPDKVLVSGESAGGHGAIYYLPKIAEMFPGSTIFQLSDGNALTTERFVEITTWWGVDALERFGFATSNNTMNDAYLHALEMFQHRKDIVLLQQNTIRDEVMTGFQASTSRVPRTDAILARWQQDMLYSTKSLKEASNDNYFFWISDCHLNQETNTTPHCLEWNDVFYTCEEEDLYFHQWLDMIVNQGKRFSVGERFLPGPLE